MALAPVTAIFECFIEPVSVLDYSFAEQFRDFVVCVVCALYALRALEIAAFSRVGRNPVFQTFLEFKQGVNLSLLRSSVRVCCYL